MIHIQWLIQNERITHVHFQPASRQRNRQAQTVRNHTQLDRPQVNRTGQRGVHGILADSCQGSHRIHQLQSIDARVGNQQILVLHDSGNDLDL